MRDNTNSFKALSRKLGREIKNCECCGADITNSIWRINQEDILCISHETIKVVCVKCFKS